MELQVPELLRSTILTNSAAEFVEKRTDLEALSRVTNPADTPKEVGKRLEFMPEFDQLFSRGYMFDSKRLYEESNKRKQTFCESLQNLVLLLRARNIDQQLNITIKNPDELSVDYVLDLINKIEHGQEARGPMKVCKDFVQRCHRKMDDNKTVVEGLLSMIPTDIYGSVLSGGFALILVAVERHFERREAIQGFLAEIPQKLEQIQRVASLHHKSLRLHSCADAIMAAVFGTLESIIDEITNTWKVKLQKFSRKMRSVFDAHEDQASYPKIAKRVKDALAELQCKIDAFQKEVDFCNQARLGRIETSQRDLEYVFSAFANGNKRQLGTLEQSVERLREQLDIGAFDSQFLLARFMDVFYQLLTSSPSFNSKTGEVDREQVKLITAEEQATIQRCYQENNTQLTKKWIKRLEGPGSDPAADIKDCLFHSEQLEADEKDQSQWILQSDELARWMCEDETTILEVSLPRPPASLTNPLSFTSALFTKSVQAAQQFPILAYFCMHRNNDSALERLTGPAALVTSVVIQLVQFIAHNHTAIDLSALDEDYCRSHHLRKARENARHGLALLKRLLLLLPENETVFIVIDCLSRLSGSIDNGEKLMTKLTHIVNEVEHVTVKVLVTDAIPDSHLARVAHVQLLVPNVVPGSGIVDIHDNKGRIVEQISRVKEGEASGICSSKKDYYDEDSFDYED